MTIKPAPADTGVVFVRTDQGGARIEALASNTAATSYATTLRRNGAAVLTVEHLLGALAGLGITNAFVEFDGDEVPILDGSAGPFIRMLVEAGIRTQDKVQPVLKVTRPVFVREGSKHLSIWPADKTSISCLIDFNHVLDRIGDLSLVGMPVIGHIVAHKSGHSLNALMVNKLLKSTLHWVLVGDAVAAAPRREAAVYQETVAVSQRTTITRRV